MRIHQLGNIGRVCRCADIDGLDTQCLSTLVKRNVASYVALPQASLFYGNAFKNCFLYRQYLCFVPGCYHVRQPVGISRGMSSRAASSSSKWARPSASFSREFLKNGWTSHVFILRPSRGCFRAVLRFTGSCHFLQAVHGNACHGTHKITACLQ